MTKQEKLNILMEIIKKHNHVNIYKKYTTDISKFMYVSYVSKNYIFVDLQMDGENAKLMNEEELMEWLSDSELQDYIAIDNVIICK